MGIKERLTKSLLRISAPIDPDIHQHIVETYGPESGLLEVQELGSIAHITTATEDRTVIKQKDGTIVDFSVGSFE